MNGNNEVLSVEEKKAAKKILKELKALNKEAQKTLQETEKFLKELEDDK